MGFSHQASSFLVGFQRLPQMPFSEWPTRGSLSACDMHGNGMGSSTALCPCWPIFQDEPVEWETPDLSQAETEQKIKEYNGQVNSNLFMSLVSLQPTKGEWGEAGTQLCA